MDLEALLLKRGESDLSPLRWNHSLRTADYAFFMADHYSIEPGAVRVAALAHDLAREWDQDRILKAALQDQKIISDFNRAHPVLLHGFAAAWLLQEEFSVQDKSLLDAVRYHTTGHPSLDQSGLVLFAADYMEPGRRHLDDIDRKRLLNLSFNEMILSVLDAMADHLASKETSLSPDSRELYQKLKEGYNKPS